MIIAVKFDDTFSLKRTNSFITADEFIAITFVCVIAHIVA